MPPHPIARIAHLSDLHLGSDFGDVGGPNRTGFIAIAETKAFRMQAHDQNILLMLPLELARLGRISRMECAKALNANIQSTPDFDAVLVTGDISTDATNDERFTFAHQYLTSTVPVAKTGVYAHQGIVGLEIDNQRLFCIPGNHDKMRETSPSRFNSAFAQSPAPCNYVSVIRPHNVPVVLFGLDSNAYEEGNIALGHIDNTHVSWFLDRFKEMESKGLKTPTGSLTAEEASGAIRCLVLHHHVVDLGPFIRRYRPSHSFTVLEGAEALLQVCRRRVDVIFHGHEHYPACFEHKEIGAIIISAGTTSEWHKSGGKNSFYTVTIFDDYSIRIIEHVWTGAEFESCEPLAFGLRRFKKTGEIEKSA